MERIFKWDIEKNEKLVRERRISFEMISKSIEDGGLLDIIDHPKLLVVKIRDYTVLVPFIESEDYVFLKTAYTSRKFTKKYLR